MTIILAILVFCILIISHEFGHFIMAKLCGIYVYDFNLGMGPKLFSFKGKETEYTIRLLPIGGSVRMMGEDEESEDPRSFGKKKVWQRMAVVFAGPFMNLVCAVVIFVIVYTGIGVASNSNIIGSLIEGKPAELAGLQPGDAVIEINDQPVQNWNEMVLTLDAQTDGQEVVVTVLRDGEELEFVLQPYWEESSGRWLMGVMQSTQRLGIFEAIGMGAKQCYQLAVLILQTFGQMITGQIEAELSGPVGIVSAVGDAAAVGTQTFLIFVAFLCVNLGVVNLLPLPALDGSRLVFLAIEGIRKKPVPAETEGKIHFIGFALLMCLILVVTYQDIVRLVTN